jgi:hypothetical protein
MQPPAERGLLQWWEPLAKSRLFRGSIIFIDLAEYDRWADLINLDSKSQTSKTFFALLEKDQVVLCCYAHKIHHLGLLFPN